MLRGMRRVVVVAALGIMSAPVSLIAVKDAFAVQSGAEVGFFNGNYLYQQCTADPRVYSGLSFCQGYLAAVADFANFMGVVCAPQGTSVGQLVDIVIKELKETPEIRSSPALLLTLITLEKTFPCPRDHPVRVLGPNTK